MSEDSPSKRINNETPIRTVELFAGVGGFRLGLERSSQRFETIWANQWEPSRKSQHAFDCYVHHFGASENHINEDIDVVKNDVPDHDLLVGGFPCQDYSVARTGAQGIEGKKGALWWQIQAILANKTPSWVLLENVDRLLKSPSQQRGRDFAVMLRGLSDLGYASEWRVINAAEYGHAQRRRRVFILAYHHSTAAYQRLQKSVSTNDAHVDTVPDTVINNALASSLLNEAFVIKDGANNNKVGCYSIKTQDYQDLVAVSDNFQQPFYNFGLMSDGVIYTTEVIPKTQPAQTLGSVLEAEPVAESFFLTDKLDKWQYLKGAKKVARTKPNGEAYFYSEGGMSFPDDTTKPARTMLTSETSVNRSSHVVSDPHTERLRTLTPIEAERLNGFDDNWTDTGMPTKFRYFVMGNALVVPVVTAIGTVIAKHF